MILLILFFSDAFQIRARCIFPCFFFQISYYLSSISFKRFRNYNRTSMELFHSSCRVSVIKVSVTVNTKISSLWHQNKNKDRMKEFNTVMYTRFVKRKKKLFYLIRNVKSSKNFWKKMSSELSDILIGLSPLLHFNVFRWRLHCFFF